MPAGRKPKPTAAKELAGNPGKRALNRNEPQPGGIAKCPGHLSKEAKKEWKRVAQELIPLGLLTSVDMAALAAYCVTYARWVKAEAQITKLGEYIKSSKSGYLIQAPWVGVANKAMELMHKFASEFGFTPSSRTRLSVEPLKPKDDDEYAISRPRDFLRPAGFERRDFGLQVGSPSVPKISDLPN
jgi:P27 family predicted phage terminase small subunit